MQPFLGQDFLLHSATARRLYHDFAAGMPIFDYHCHLPVAEIAADKRFANLTDIWLRGDHYKWRAMRANGIPERLITGDAGDFEKFQAWAATVPMTLRNPLYHWTHLELQRIFGITDGLLNPDSAREIYERCTQLLQRAEYGTRGILRRMHVRVVCTTDDPCDSLEDHLRLKSERDPMLAVRPAFRPDRALAVDRPMEFNAWIDRLEHSAGLRVQDFDALLEALRRRHDAFHQAGCRLSDHGLEHPFAADYHAAEVERALATARRGEAPAPGAALQFKSALMIELARMDAARGWTQQLHLGALRNVNTRALAALGPDSGYDTIGDWDMARSLARFLDCLDREERLPKTILYVLNPRDNDMAAAMIGCFQDGSLPGKMQFGSAWWFNDQKEGIERQLNALSNLGLLRRFVGMLTDSRSFLSYPRHEYFRRVLCNLIGSDVERGELPHDLPLLGAMVQDICFRNAEAYFGIEGQG
jgi:glucuronate isomerase